MKKYSIITCIYNNKSLVQSVLEKIYKYTSDDFEHIIVYNHPVDSSLDLIRDLTRGKDNVIILDRGYNLGCTDGLDLGFSAASGKYILKVDDDVLVPFNTNWLQIMGSIMDSMPKLAFLSPNSNVIQGGKIETMNLDLPLYKGGLNLYLSGIISWTCLMMRKDLYREFGPLKGTVVTVSGNVRNPRLYGGEEQYYCIKARQAGLPFGYLTDLWAIHLDNENRDIEYVLWKYCYGYLGVTHLPYDEFKNNKSELDKCFSYWLKENNQWYSNKAQEYFKK